MKSRLNPTKFNERNDAPVQVLRSYSRIRSMAQSLSTFNALKAFGLFAGVLIVVPVHAQVSGTVFRDFNGNGTKDVSEPLVPGVIINAYNGSNALIASFTSAGTAAPNYTIPAAGAAYNNTPGSNTGSVSAGTAVRLEFIVPVLGSCVQAGIDHSSFVGSQNGSSVQFASGGASNINFAVHNPNDYNLGTSGVNVFIPCYISGDPLIPGVVRDADWFVGYPYDNVGNSQTTPPTQKLNGAVIGTTWGVAYSKQAKKIFTSAFLKRHAGFGVAGTGGIYLLTPSGNTFNASTFYNMDANGHRTRADASAPAYGEGTSYTIASNSIITYLGTNDPLTGKPSGLGVVGTNANRGLNANPLAPSYDPAAFDQVGKVGLGDIEISDDGRFLFVMNLYSRKVFRLELDSATNPTGLVANGVTSYDIPATATVNGEYRPWALKFHRNELYVGLVASAENGGTDANLSASVYKLTNPTAAATFAASPVLTFPLDYTKNGSYNPWTNDSDIPSSTATAVRYATPVLSDIEFSDNGDMILGIMDRCGHQWGENNRRFLKSSTTSITISTSGDILVAGLNCNTGAFALENNGSFTSGNGLLLSGTNTGAEGPGGKEFFDDNSSVGDPHAETATGSLAVLKGQGAVLLSAFAQSAESGDAGTMKLTTSDGTFVNYYELYNRNDFDGVFAKANGLGDVELSSPESPIEIGNRIWTDTNGNGIQDAGEAGISGVVVKLLSGTTEIASATTDGNGNYIFSSGAGTTTPAFQYGIAGLVPNANYTVRVPTTIGGLSLTAANQGTRDTVDSDAPANGDIPVASTSIASNGVNNHTFDVGYSSIAVPTCDITDLAVTPALCNDNGTPDIDTDDYYTASVTVTFSDKPATGNLVLSGVALHSSNTVTTVATTATTSATSHAFTGVRLKANGVANNITATFSVDPVCTMTSPANVLAPCSTPNSGCCPQIIIDAP